MAEAFLQLTRQDQREVLETAASESGRTAYLLEKDVWIVWTLQKLFAAEFASYLVFKGGT